MKLKHITEQQVATRTLYVHGSATQDAVADITVDDMLVHQGSITSGVLFNFSTDVTKHGSVKVNIKMLQGSITITHNRVTYPATNGYVNMPQPIIQPNLPNTITDETTYDHYMFNGPTQWIIDETDSTVVVDDFYSAVVRQFMVPDWQYNNYPVDINNLDYRQLVVDR
jgi:hypothetical protein